MTEYPEEKIYREMDRKGRVWKNNVTLNKKYTKGRKTITEYAEDREKPVYGSGIKDYRGQKKTHIYHRTVTTRDKNGNVIEFENDYRED